MNDATISIGDDQLKELVTAAVLEAINGEKRDQLISGAIQSLLFKQDHTRETPLEQAFLTAVRSVAYEQCREYVANNAEVSEKIHAAIVAGLEKVLGDEEKLPNAVADAFETAVRGLMREGY